MTDGTSDGEWTGPSDAGDSGSEAVAVAPDPRPAPPDLEGLRNFVNSDNRYYGVDNMSADRRSEWFGRVFPEFPVDDIDDTGWERLVDLRSGIRALIAREEGAAVRLSRYATRYPLTLTFADDSADTIGADPAASRVDARVSPARWTGESALAGSVLGALQLSIHDGRFSRLHLCARPDCGWCFFDPSKNRSARWCSSDPCGHVMKTRAFRERQRTSA